MTKLKVAYFGTPDFSARLLGKLLDNEDLPIAIVQVATQPDQKAGRKQILTPSPVKVLAQERGIPVSGDLQDIDLAILFAYGDIISLEMLLKPKYGFWNLHPSLLPKYRGPSPVAEPLLRDDSETGVTIMKMDQELDHGPIIAQERRYIFPVERRDQLTERLVDLGYEMLVQLFGKYAGNMEAVPLSEQDHDKATYTKLFTKEDGFIEFASLKDQISQNSRNLYNLFRGLYPWPGIWTKVMIKGKEQRLKITKIHWEQEKIVTKKVQLEGKNEVLFEEFERAYALFRH